MADYQPTSRRPIAGLFRLTAHGAVRLCLKWGVHPDVISYFSIVAAAGAGVCFWLCGRWQWLLLIAPLFCLLRLWCNMLDGMVALAAKQASLRGEIVNELPDRISDVLIFVGVAHSGLANPFLGYWAAIMAVMTAYVGTLGQAVTGRRRFEGMMSKQHRMAVLLLASWGMFFWPDGRMWRLSILDWGLVVIVFGCVETVAIRLMKILADLRLRQPKGKADLHPSPLQFDEARRGPEYQAREHSAGGGGR